MTEQPEIKTKRRVSKIWLLPFVAVLLGAGLLYEQWLNQGTTITITLDTAEGVEPGKTKIKSRNVEIGRVQSLGFSKDHSQIRLTALIDKDMSFFLREDSQFWVVRPRVSKDGVSGIGTLLSGAYIEVAPGISSQFETQFVGLENPPTTPPNADGIFITLISEGGKPLSDGDPVTYRGLKVGQVEFQQFDRQSRTVNYTIFVGAPYDDLITTNSVFWKASGITVSASTEGFNIDVASLETLLSGGVEFGLPDDAQPGKSILGRQSFKLHDSERLAQERREFEFIEYVVLVEDSVSGLSKDAPVDYRGVRVGTVVKPYMTYEEVLSITGDRAENRIPVLIRLEPERVVGNTFTLSEFREQVATWIKGGVTASLESTNFLTGALKVSLDYNGFPRTDIDTFGPFEVIPASQGGFAGITSKVESVLTKIEQLPLHSMVTNTSQTMLTADATLRDLRASFGRLEAALSAIEGTFDDVNADSDLYRELRQTMDEFRVTLKALQPDAPGYASFYSAMLKLQATLDNAQPLIKSLTNKPNALIFSSAKPPDQEPSPIEVEQ